ncbi:MAG: class I SAM-dependent rRNA methyltransferase [Candidatus Eisenbacteria bacterium]
MSELPRVHLKKNEDRRVRIGHPWVFSNEVERFEGPIEEGGLVDVYSFGRTFLARGYINTQSQIMLRVLSREPEEIDGKFFLKRIRRAIQYRDAFARGRDAVRVVFSEADFLPGLIVDRYLDYLVVQTTTLGMERHLGTVLDCLEELFSPTAIVLRNDAHPRAQEGLPLHKEVARGTYENPLLVRDMSIVLVADLMRGQKTGLFLDQSENRAALSGIVDGKRVLDSFCYLGAWGIEAARQGAAETVLVDSSPRAVEMAKRCAALNGVLERCEFVQENCFSYLSRLHMTGERFDVVIVDPPGLVKSKRRLRAGVELYQRINTDAMKLLPPGGILITCSCSHNVDREIFLGLLARSARIAKRDVQIVETRSQSRDHPILLAGRVSEYLKCVTLQVW